MSGLFGRSLSVFGKLRDKVPECVMGTLHRPNRPGSIYASSDRCTRAKHKSGANCPSSSSPPSSSPPSSTSSPCAGRRLEEVETHTPHEALSRRIRACFPPTCPWVRKGCTKRQSKARCSVLHWPWSVVRYVPGSARLSPEARASFRENEKNARRGRVQEGRRRTRA